MLTHKEIQELKEDQKILWDNLERRVLEGSISKEQYNNIVSGINNIDSTIEASRREKERKKVKDNRMFLIKLGILSILFWVAVHGIAEMWSTKRPSKTFTKPKQQTLEVPDLDFSFLDNQNQSIAKETLGLGTQYKKIRTETNKQKSINQIIQDMQQINISPDQQAELDKMVYQWRFDVLYTDRQIVTRMKIYKETCQKNNSKP